MNEMTWQYFKELRTVLTMAAFRSLLMVITETQTYFKCEVFSKAFDLCLQTLKYSSKSHPGGDHRHDKMRDSSDVTPPCKMLRRSDSPENKHIDSTGHSRAKGVHTHRARDRDGGESGE